VLQLVAWFLYALTYYDDDTHASLIAFAVVDEIMPALTQLLHFNDDEIIG
jgi:hypothetical protein